MASIRKPRREGHSYQVRWTGLDGREHSRACPNAATARSVKREIEEAIAHGREWRPAVPVWSVGDAVDHYVEHRTSAKRPGTAAQDRKRLTRWERWIAARHGAKPSPGACFTLADLDAFHAAMLADGCAVRTANAYAGTVYSLWIWLFDRHRDRMRIDVPPRRFERPAPDPTPTRAPTWEQVDAMLAHLAHPKLAHLYRNCVVQRYTGLRLSQARALRWDDFDLVAGTLHVRPELGKSRAERAGRTIPVTPHLLRELAAWPRSHETVVGWTATGKAYHLDVAAAWRASGADPALWRARTTHAIRRAFRTGLYRAGCDGQAAEFYIGHARGLEGVYTADDALRLQACADAVPAISGGRTLGTVVHSDLVEARE